MADEAQPGPERRREQVRRGVILLLVAIVLLLLALLVFGNTAPEWNADGSRDAHPTWARALLCASLIAGTMLVPISARALLLAALPNKLLAIVLGVAVGIIGAVVVPIELWMAMVLTEADEPGTRERYESGDSDWDWD